MSSSLPIELASTLQSASINRQPSLTHDINPSTSASRKIPVKLTSTSSLTSSYNDEASIDLDDVDIEGIEDTEDDIPYSVLRPAPRKQSFGPLPDLRFEQSYLKSVEGREGWGVVWVTARDQVFMPLIQGMVWSLVLHGWRFWNRNAQLSGSTVGAKVRRWWYRTNNWTVPTGLKSATGNEKLAKDVGDYYQTQNSSD